MSQKEFEKRAKQIVAGIDECRVSDAVSIVWFAYLLHNMKAILVTGMTRGKKLYEVTYNADKDEIYVDGYEKKENRVIRMGTTPG